MRICAETETGGCPSVGCPACGLSFLINGYADVVICPECRQEAHYQNGVLKWKAAESKKENDTVSFFKKVKRKVSSLYDTYLNLVSSRFSPLTLMVKKNRAAYYERVLSSQEMAEAWVDHYCNNLDLPEGASVLDFGCGQGRALAFLKRKGFLAYGQDIYEDQWWENLKPDIFFQTVPSDKTYLPWPDEQFHMVLTYMVNSFFDDPRFEKLAEEIWRVVKPGGYWVNVESNPHSYAVGNFTKYYGRKPRTFERVCELMKAKSWLVLDHWYEGFYAPLFPGFINAVRFSCAGDRLDINDYRTPLLKLLPDRKKGLIVIQARKA